MQQILVIEDNLEVRENLVELLELSNYDVSSAENGKIGVQKAVELLPDLILCDVMMPELDGFGVLHILSKNPKTANIPFIFLTAKSEKTDFRKGMNLGADDYITKPFDEVELFDAIKMRLEKSARLKQDFQRTKEGLKAFIDEAKGMQALKQLSEDTTTISFKKKAAIFQEGDYPRYLYFINEGKVKIFKTNEFGKEYVVSLLDKGDFFGYEEIIKNEHYQVSAAALEFVELSMIPRKDFLQLLTANRDVSARMIKMLADDIIQKEEQLLSLAYNSIRKRVADALIDLHQHYSKEGDGQFSIMRDDLAGIVGTAKETVIRTLTDFRKENLITINNGIITILDKEKLGDLPN